jgi:dihydroorotate dehydrogenase (NAD+) catalytic subunit
MRHSAHRGDPLRTPQRDRLQGVGVRAFVEKVLPALRAYDTAVLVNVCGDTVEEYAEVTRIVDQAEGVAGVEINISCPNVKKGGMAFGGDPRMTSEVVSAVRKATRSPSSPSSRPTWPTSRSSPALPKKRGGRRLLHQHAPGPGRRRGDAAAAPGLRDGRPLRSRHPPRRRAHGLAGRARGKIPVIGIGGIASASDALEFLIAGCRAVQIGTANFVDPGVYDRVRAGLEDYLRRHGLDDINRVVGTLRYPGLPVAEELGG